MKKNKTDIIFSSKPFYLWVTSSILAIPVVLFIEKLDFDFYYLILSTIIVYLNCHFSFKKIIFTKDVIIKFYPLRFFRRKVIYSYQELDSIEIRNIKAPYHLPYVIIHHKKSSFISKYYFSNRAFIYEDIMNLEPLIEFLVKKEITIKLNFSKENRKEKKKLLEMINNCALVLVCLPLSLRFTCLF